MKSSTVLKRGDPVKITYGGHAGQRGEFVKREYNNTPNCMITVKIKGITYRFTDGWVQPITSKR
jgi:hypothetical protein